MVDLAKIRKKAKAKNREAESETSRNADESPSESWSRRVDESPSDTPSPTGAVEHSKPPATKRAPKPSSTTGASKTDASTTKASLAREADSEPRAGAETSSKLERFKAQAGKKREHEAHDGGAEEDAGEERLELLTFVIAGEQYAIDIEQIIEIVTPRRVTRVPNADQSVVGIASLRGTIVTLVDVRRRLGHPPAGPEDADTRVIVIDMHNETIGFLVDRVLRVIKTSADAIEPHPVVHSTELVESIRGVFRAGDALTILLDLDKLLDHRGLANGAADGRESTLGNQKWI